MSYAEGTFSVLSPRIFKNDKEFVITKRSYDYYNVNLFYEYHYPAVDKDDIHVYPIPEPGQNITYSIDQFYETDDFINISGWAVIRGQDVNHAKIYLYLRQGSSIFVYPTKDIRRDDIAEKFDSLNILYSGFSNTINKRDLLHGSYNVGLLIIEAEEKRKELVLTGYVTDLDQDSPIDIPEPSKDISFNIDFYESIKEQTKVVGWALMKGVNSIDNTVYMCLSTEQSQLVFSTSPIIRTDVTGSFADGLNYNNCGFEGLLDYARLKKDQVYDIGILIRNSNYPSSLTLTDFAIDLRLPSIPDSTDTISRIAYHIDSFDEKDDKITMSGWAFTKKFTKQKTKTYLYLVSKKGATLFRTSSVKRIDVAEQFKNSKYEDSGFSVTVNKKIIQDSDHLGYLYIVGADQRIGALQLLQYEGNSQPEI